MKASAWWLTTGFVLGLSASYVVRPLLHPEMASQLTRTVSTRGPSPLLVQSECELSSVQLDHLADRLAPALIEKIAASHPPEIGSEQTQTIRNDSATTANEMQRVQAFTRATHLIDQMIADRQVTPEGLSDAQALLRQTGQSDRGYEVMSRVSAAVNRGDLTPAEAGLVPPAIGR